MELKVLHSLIESARDVYPDSLPMQALVVTQAIHESGFHGKSGGSQLALRYNNLFGIKKLKSRPQAFVLLPTWEVINGRTVQVKEPFAVFDDFEDCFKQHKVMMNWSRYRNVLESKTASEAFTRIQKSGWATDPSYTVRLNHIYNKYVKDSL